MMLALTAILATTMIASAAIAPVLVGLPAGTHLRFHLDRPLSSDRSKTGQRFSFVLLAPVALGGRVVVPGGAVGTGTLLLAGHAGTSGHEGDLTLRLDTLRAANGAQVMFCGQRLRINGRNEKIVSGVLGFVPYAGLGARFIRGSEIRITTKTPIETVLLQPSATPPNYCPAVLDHTARS
jgi:hypothetical protein